MTESDSEVARITAAEMLKNDAASALLEIKLEDIEPGYAKVSMIVRPDMANGFGILHGGFAFTLADTAFALACNSYNCLTVAQSCDVDFTNAGAVGDHLIAVCEEQILRGRSGIYDVTVTNQDDVVIALFRGKSRTLGQPITKDVRQIKPDHASKAAANTNETS